MTRVPEFLMFNKSQDSIGRVREQMAKNQEQAVTSKRVNRASDDPVANMRTVGLRSQLKRDDQVSQNLELAVSLVNITDSNLGELTDVLVRAKELAIQMSSTTNSNDDARSAVSKEVEQLRLRAVQLGNARLGDRYIFGGFTTNRPPFDEHGNYYGDDGTTQIEVDKGQRLSLNVPGLMPFFGLTSLPPAADPGFPKSPQKASGSEPTVPGALRSPASLMAERLGVSESDPEAFGQIQSNTGVNVFHTLQTFAEGLRTGDQGQVQGCLDSIDSALKQVLQSRAMIGARQNALKMSQESIEGAKETGSNLISQAEDADVLKVFSDLAKNENSLKATLEMNRKILSPSLLEYLK